jgi:hypothetical protein
LAEKKEVLVHRDQLMPELQYGFSVLKTALLGMSTELKTVLDLQYGIDTDLTIIEKEIFDALSSLSQYDPGSTEDREGAVRIA